MNMPETEKKDPSEIPEEIREYVEQMHKDKRESRPDEGWRIKSADRSNDMAPYKKDEEAESAPMMDTLPGYDDGGQVPDPAQPADDSFLSKLANSPAVKFAGAMTDPVGAGVSALRNSVSSVMKPELSAIKGLEGPLFGMDTPKPAPVPPPAVAPAPSLPVTAKAAPAGAPMAPPAPAGPELTDQTYMDRANKMLGLNPEEQAGFMKLLGGNAQKAQLGSAVAGIGDAIASGGTLGKVNPGALNKSEELIQNRTNEGLQGMQTLRENQGKTFEMADKLQARDPASPLSKWAQKAYAPVGKKIGLNLDNASAALIGDVTGKGVDALNTEYQNQLKQMGLSLQQKQVEATIGNQKAEREIAREGHQAEAAKTLADRGILKTIANAIPGTAGHHATQVLEKQAMGNTGGAGPVSVNSRAEYDALPAGTHYVDSFGTQKVKK